MINLPKTFKSELICEGDYYYFFFFGGGGMGGMGGGGPWLFSFGWCKGGGGGEDLSFSTTLNLNTMAIKDIPKSEGLTHSDFSTILFIDLLCTDIIYNYYKKITNIFHLQINWLQHYVQVLSMFTATIDVTLKSKYSYCTILL